MLIETSRPIAQFPKGTRHPGRNLGSRVARYRRDQAGDELELNITERARLRELELGIRESRMENEFLKKQPEIQVINATVRPSRNSTRADSNGASLSP